MTGEDKVMNLKEAADYLRVHQQTMYKLLRSGDLPAARVGREWRILKSEMDKFLRGEVRGKRDERTD